MSQAVRKGRTGRRFSVDMGRALNGLKVLAVLLAVAAIAWGGHLLYRKYDVPVAVIGVKGEIRQVDAAEVEGIVAANLGGGFLSLDLAGICEALEKHPWIASASARRKWPDEVEITVEEETPIARWGEEKFLNNQGRVLEVADVQLSDSLPALDGPAGSSRRVMQQYRNFSQILAPLDLKVEVCRLAPRNNWVLTLDNGMQLTAGKEPVAEKMDRFVRVWNEELRDRMDDIETVDIRYANGVAVNWRDVDKTAEITDLGDKHGKYPQ